MATENGDYEEEAAEVPEITKEVVMEWVREGISEVMGGADDAPVETDKPLSKRDIEEATKRAVQEAMQTLSAAKPKPKPKPKPAEETAAAPKQEEKTEDEAAPISSKKRNWSQLLWGE